MPHRESRPSAQQPVRRPRINQPLGFLITETLRPSYYYGRNHDYVYYPESWVDESTGTSYQKGYYDENGQFYDNVAFQKDGKYENVVCHCPYCFQDTVMNLDAGENAVRNLQCPHCGGPMEIQSELDDYLSGPAENTHVYNSEESLRQFRESKKTKKRKRWPWIVGILAALVIGSSLTEDEEPQYSYQNDPVQQIEVINNGSTQDSWYLEDTVSLEKTGQNSFRVVPSGSGDKTLVWDEDADSYDDEDSQCWLWYHTEVEPPIWQYWYEVISSDYGDCGWMEHDSEGWFVEASQGNWIHLPERYSTADLWYIED